MAVKVMPLRGMNTVGPRTFENGTRYELKDATGGLMLNIYAGNKKIYTVAPGYWESVEIIDLLDQKGSALDEKVKTTKKKAPKASKSRVTTRSGAQIRTSPDRGGETNRRDGKKLR